MSRVTNIERIGSEYVIDAVHRGVEANGQRFPVTRLQHRLTDAEWLDICCERACRNAEILAQSVPERADRENLVVPDAYTVDQRRLA